jgi:plasmid stability protein
MEASMGDMLIRDMPDSLKHEIAQAAASRRQSLSSKAIDLLRKGLIAEGEAKHRPGQSAWVALRSAFEKDGPVTGEFAEIMDEIEAERKRDFGRPVDFDNDEETSDDRS